MLVRVTLNHVPQPGRSAPSTLREGSQSIEISILSRLSIRKFWSASRLVDCGRFCRQERRRWLPPESSLQTKRTLKTFSSGWTPAVYLQFRDKRRGHLRSFFTRIKCCRGQRLHLCDVKRPRVSRVLSDIRHKI
jgi:hypothetical protein